MAAKTSLDCVLVQEPPWSWLRGHIIRESDGVGQGCCWPWALDLGSSAATCCSRASVVGFKSSKAPTCRAGTHLGLAAVGLRAGRAESCVPRRSHAGSTSRAVPGRRVAERGEREQRLRTGYIVARASEDRASGLVDEVARTTTKPVARFEAHNRTPRANVSPALYHDFRYREYLDRLGGAVTDQVALIRNGSSGARQ
jgi:hypothetical protein